MLGDKRFGPIPLTPPPTPKRDHKDHYLLSSTDKVDILMAPGKRTDTRWSSRKFLSQIRFLQETYFSWCNSVMFLRVAAQVRTLVIHRDLWWTKWTRTSFFTQLFGLAVSIILPLLHTQSCTSWVAASGLLSGPVWRWPADLTNSNLSQQCYVSWTSILNTSIFYITSLRFFCIYPTSYPSIKAENVQLQS
jgi:hypothetical protein